MTIRARIMISAEVLRTQILWSWGRNTPKTRLKQPPHSAASPAGEPTLFLTAQHCPRHFWAETSDCASATSPSANGERTPPLRGWGRGETHEQGTQQPPCPRVPQLCRRLARFPAAPQAACGFGCESRWLLPAHGSLGKRP